MWARAQQRLRCACRRRVCDASTAGSVSVRGSEGVSVSSGGAWCVCLLRARASSLVSCGRVLVLSTRSRTCVSERQRVEELVCERFGSVRSWCGEALDLCDRSSWVGMWGSLGAEACYSL